MSKKKLQQNIRYELRAIVSIIANRDITTDEYNDLSVMLRKYAKVSRSDLEVNQAKKLNRLRDKIAKLEKEIKKLK